MLSRSRCAAAIAGLTLAVCAYPSAQDRLKSMPGYDQFQKMSPQIPGSVKLGALAARWKDDGSSFEYVWNGKRYRYDVATKHATELGDAPDAPQGGRRRGGSGGGQPERGPPFDSSAAPDKTPTAFYTDRNVSLPEVAAADPRRPTPGARATER